MRGVTILVIGTYDTKNDELDYMNGCILSQGGRVLSMDVGVLGDPATEVDITRHEVATEAKSSIQEIISFGDENKAMQKMAQGASALAVQMHKEGKIHGVLILGGSMGTDLALDVCRSLPIGFPKHVVSTVSFSPMIPPSRLAPDIQMTLWAGGLYGLNSICKSSLSLAAGSVLGAARAAEPWQQDQPVVGMTSFGSSVLQYMVKLKPEIERRGFELAVFHATGMGGMAFERLAENGAFACVMDFAPQEMTNLIYGSALHAGESRMRGAGRSGTPQIVAPGCIDLIDFPTWQQPPDIFKGRDFHEHNRLICSAGLNAEERCRVVRAILDRMAQSTAPAHFVLPVKGIQGWDQKGQPFHDPASHHALCEAVRSYCPKPVILDEQDCHINDQAFADRVLTIFDEWLTSGVVKSLRRDT